MSKARNIADLGSNDVLDTDGTGATVSGHLTVSDSTPDFVIQDTDGTNQLMKMQQVGGASMIKFRSDTNDGELYFTGEVTGRNKMKIATNGDVSLYADDGTTQGFYWDASTQRLGVKTITPGAILQVGGNAKLGSASATTFSGSLTTGGLDVMVGSGNQYDGAFQVWDDNELTTPRFTVTREGNVGIGVTPPSAAVRGLYYTGGGATYSTSSTYRYDMVNAYFDTAWKYIGNGVATQIYQANGEFIFNQASSNSSGAGAALTWDEAMRIDSSGNLLVGTTSTTLTGNAGFTYQGGITTTSNNGSLSAIMNRNTNDGDIVQFRKDNSTVGVIGVISGQATFGTGDTGFVTDAGSDAIYPWNVGTNASRDNAINLGAAAVRWKDLYLSGGVYLGGTGAANYLDDYEIGTWTPTVEGSTTAGTATYTVRDANYVKVGDLVNVTTYIDWSGHTGTGNLNITGLPFTLSAVGNNYPPFTVHTSGISLSANHYSSAAVGNDNSTTIQLKQYPVGGGGQSNVPMDAAGVLLISGTYRAV